MSIESDIALLASKYAVSNIQWNAANDALNDAAGETLWSNARYHINTSSEYIQGGGFNITAYVGGETNYLVTNILAALNAKIDAVSEYELTMEHILAVMMDAIPPEIEQFVGIMDAYRQAIWNIDFNQKYYASLAKRFIP